MQLFGLFSLERVRRPSFSTVSEDQRLIGLPHPLVPQLRQHRPERKIQG